MKRFPRLACVCILLVSCTVFQAPAGEEVVFSWRQASGQTLRIMLNMHPYSEGIRRRIPDFEKLTGIRVAYIMHPETVYFERLGKAFTDPASEPDVFMTGVYQVWEYATQGRIADLDTFLRNPALTRQGYDVNDFFPAISGAFRWTGKAGSKTGTGPLWALPIGFEASALTYNREVLARHRLPPPRGLEELIATGKELRDFAGPGSYGVAARGVAGWNALHSGYMAAYANYGAIDMEIEDGRLVSRVNSPEAVAVTELWVRMLREAGSAEWDKNDWYRCLEDVGKGRAAILLDSDILGFFANAPDATAQSGKLALAPPPVRDGGGESGVKSNLWVWGFGMNAQSRHPEAAWLFLQYFTSKEFQMYSVLEWMSVNPPRKSVFAAPAFQKTLAQMTNYSETFNRIIDTTAIVLTPNPHFFEISGRWAAVVQDIAKGNYASTREGMDDLKAWMDALLADVPVE